MKYEVHFNRLTINNHLIEFADDIEEVVDFGLCLVARTKRFNSTTLENVFGVSEDGIITWQIPQMNKLIYKGKEYVGITNPYVGLTKIDGKKIKLHNYDGTTFEVDAISGEVLTNPIESRIGRRPW